MATVKTIVIDGSEIMTTHAQVSESGTVTIEQRRFGGNGEYSHVTLTADEIKELASQL